jgi:hypothetical protein
MELTYISILAILSYRLHSIRARWNVISRDAKYYLIKNFYLYLFFFLSDYIGLVKKVTSTQPCSLQDKSEKIMITTTYSNLSFHGEIVLKLDP